MRSYLLFLLVCTSTTSAAPLTSPARTTVRVSVLPIPLDPLASDLARFPNARDTEAVLVWGCDHLDHLEINAAIDPRGRHSWIAVRDETMRRMQPWVYLREAQLRTSGERADSVLWRFYARRRKVALGVWYGAYDQSLAGRRAALERLRDALGPDAFASGFLPPPAVLSALVPID